MLTQSQKTIISQKKRHQKWVDGFEPELRNFTSRILYHFCCEISHFKVIRYTTQEVITKIEMYGATIDKLKRNPNIGNISAKKLMTWYNTHKK